MTLPIETARKTAGYLTLVPAYGRDYKSKRDLMADWDAGKDFIVQDMMSPYDGKPINKADALAAGVRNVNIRYKRMRSVAVIKVAGRIACGPGCACGGSCAGRCQQSNLLPVELAAISRSAKFPEGKTMTVDEVAEVVGPEFKEMNEDPPESVTKLREDMEEAMDADLLPIERAASEKVAEVRPGQKFVIVDVSVPGGKWVDGVIYDGTREADREAEKMMSQGKRVQVIDAVWFAPAEAKLRALGMRAAAARSGSDQQAEKLEAEAEANEAQADADRQKADAARMKESAKKKLPSELKEHQFTSDDNPNPKGSDKDGDGKTNEPSPLKGKKANLRRAAEIPSNKRDFISEYHEYLDALEETGSPDVEKTIAKMWKENERWAREAEKTHKPRRASVLRRAARRHFAGRRYDYGEVIDFLTEDKSTPELERMWKKWSAMVEDLHERWIEGWAEANAPELLDESIDYAELAWKAFGSVTGMGIGLWEGDFLGDEHDEAFEKVVERDSKVSRFGQDLNDEITMVQEGEDEESMRMASRRKMLRKAFVPDSVDGWLEWADGTRTAAGKISPAEIKKKIADMENFLRKLKDYDPFLRGPIHHSYQGVLDQVEGLQKALDEHEGSSKRAFRRA